jgi:hypothetical protein
MYAYGARHVRTWPVAIAARGHEIADERPHDEMASAFNIAATAHP